MDNYDTAVESARTATESYGSAQQENEKYMDSFNAKITQLKARLEELAYTAGESGLGKALVSLTDIGINLVSGLTDIIENFYLHVALMYFA